MSNEYEFLFNNFMNPLRSLNFNESFCEDTRTDRREFNCKSTANIARPSGSFSDNESTPEDGSFAVVIIAAVVAFFLFLLFR